VGLSDKSDKSLRFFSSVMFAARRFSVPNIKVEILGKRVCLQAKRQLLLCHVALNKTSSKLLPVGNFIKFRLAAV
jgi:hypothetical protein